MHASQLLRSSLEGAATAVEALKQGKEAQTNKWLLTMAHVQAILGFNVNPDDGLIMDLFGLMSAKLFNCVMHV